MMVLTDLLVITCYKSGQLNNFRQSAGEILPWRRRQPRSDWPVYSWGQLAEPDTLWMGGG